MLVADDTIVLLYQCQTTSSEIVSQLFICVAKYILLS